MISPLVTIPMTLAHLGEVAFGLWMTIASLTAVLTFADLGLGNSILSDISTAVGSDDRKRIKVIVSTTYGCICLICLLLLPIGMMISYAFDWGRAFGISEPSVAQQTPRAVMIAFALFVIGIPAGLIYKVQIAFQKAFAANLWQAAGSLAGMGLIIASVKAKLSLPFIVASFFGGPVQVWSINTIYFFRGSRREIRPDFGSIDLETFRKLVSQSAQFLFLSILLTLGTALDTFLVSKVSGLENGAKYSIALRVAALLSLAPTMMYMPLWAANGEAIGRGDFAWVRSTVLKMTLICVALTLMIGAPVMAGSDFVFKLWLHSDMTISRLLLGGMFMWAFLQCATAPRFMVLNSLVMIRPQIWMYFSFLLLSFPAKILVMKRFGVDFVPWVNCAIFVLLVAPWLQSVYRSASVPTVSKN
jgi:O-antigen/teichoic acid export membrane protein